MNAGLTTIIGIFAAFITLAMVAVLVSQKAQTSSIIGAFSSGGANLISAATAPVTGASATVNTGSSSMPGH